MSKEVNKEKKKERKKLSKKTFYIAPKSTHESGCITAPEPVLVSSVHEKRWRITFYIHLLKLIQISLTVPDKAIISIFSLAALLQ